jgi:hypothetical protein
MEFKAQSCPYLGVIEAVAVVVVIVVVTFVELVVDGMRTVEEGSVVAELVPKQIPFLQFFDKQSLSERQALLSEHNSLHFLPHPMFLN